MVDSLLAGKSMMTGITLCVLNFKGKIFVFLVGKKICGVLIFMDKRVPQNPQKFMRHEI